MARAYRNTQSISSCFDIIINTFVTDYFNFINIDIMRSYELLVNNYPKLDSINMHQSLEVMRENCRNYLLPILQKFGPVYVKRLGDIHCRGKCTLLLEVDHRKLIYKPICNSQLILLNNILSLFNRSGLFQFHIIELIESSDHFSLVEYLTDEKCGDGSHYSYHYGALIYILTLLRGVDFHSENIFCVLNAPTIIDCETLFYPIIRNTKSFDLSATLLIPTHQNNHSIMSKMQLSMESLLKGIHKAHELTELHRDCFVKLIEKCQKLKTRIIFKPTRFYYDVLKKSTHPELLLDQSKRKEYIRSCLSGEREISKTIIEYEVNDIMQFDIPYFHYLNDKLYSSSNIEIDQQFTTTPVAEIFDYMSKLSVFKSDLIKRVMEI